MTCKFSNMFMVFHVLKKKTNWLLCVFLHVLKKKTNWLLVFVLHVLKKKTNWLLVFVLHVLKKKLIGCLCFFMCLQVRLWPTRVWRMSSGISANVLRSHIGRMS
jgi:hypothetical protein